MARTAVTVNTFTPLAALADPAGTTADTTNDHKISGVPPEELLLRIKQTAATTSTATIKAGANPPAFEAGQGDLTKAMAQNEVWWIGPLTSGRFVQANGDINVDLDATFTGTITAFHVPRTA